MQLEPNEGKNLIVAVDGQKWMRLPVKTHFIAVDDNLDDIVKKYVAPVSQNEDIVAIGQKIVSIIQKRVVYKKDLKVGFWAKFLSKFVKKTPYGFSVGNPLKMQVAINISGLPRVLLASLVGGVGKIVGLSGVFYKVVGNQVNEIDGFYGGAFAEYENYAMLGPIECDLLCDNLKESFGFSFCVPDVNDLGGNILGRSQDLIGKEKLILQILKDNPAGQSDQLTPIILIRKA